MSMLIYCAQPQQVVALADLVASQPGVTDITVSIPDGVEASVVDELSSTSLSIVLLLGKAAHVHCKIALQVADGCIERTLRIVCRERESVAEVSIACHTTAAGVLTITTIQDHIASHTQSSVRIMGVSENNSRTTVSSTIYIAKNQKEVVARQVHKHLLLDMGARAVSVPALDILSDDVSCSHGSAITHLNITHLFYLQARGYDEKMARNSIVKAFLAN